MTAVCVVTQIPSPYQVELFDAASRSGLDVTVAYLQSSDRSRQWVTPTIGHDHCFLDKDQSGADEWIRRNELVVFSSYQQWTARRLLRLRLGVGRPWAFWGERPGARLSGWLGRQLRTYTQRSLRRSRAPIWGIGNWAVEGYRCEFGNDRVYVNLPYFSNLDRFLALKRQFTLGRPRRFLFSGTFSLRKGIDLLASAFCRLVKDGINAELHLLGAGPLEEDVTTQLSRFGHRVYFHGFKQWAELEGVYAQGDVFCAPSRYDGWGLVVPEALASGMPVISTDRTGSALELIRPSHGWIVPAGNKEALLAAMRSAVAVSNEQRVDMCRSARRTAMQYSLAAGVDRFSRAIELSLAAWDNPDFIGKQ